MLSDGNDPTTVVGRTLEEFDELCMGKTHLPSCIEDPMIRNHSSSSQTRDEQGVILTHTENLNLNI